MIYKVTVQSGGNNNADKNSINCKDSTCFVSLISSSSDSSIDEEVLTIGRKNATIILDGDKCV